jgi:hypothetical protein
MCGFIQPSFVVEMLDRPDPDAFNDRQFFVCPEEVEYKYSQLKVPIDPSIPRLENVFKNIKLAHKCKVHYSLSNEAQVEFITIHDELSERKLAIKDDEDRRGILSKAKGQLARLAMVIQGLNESFMKCNDCDHIWEYKISKESLLQAKNILDYIIQEKFALMKPEVEVTQVQPVLQTGSQKLDENPQYLSKFLSFKGREIMASDVSKYRLMPAIQSDKKNKYPVEVCKDFMKEVSTAGYGSIIESGNRRSITFRKRHSSDMGGEQVENLKRMNFDIEAYDSFLEQTDTSCSSGDEQHILLSTPSQ